MSSKSPGQKRKQIIIQIVMLDDQEVPFQIDTKLIGKDLISLVYQYLKLIESDYFGLEYIDSKGKKCWLDYDKPVSKQVQNNAKLMFCVKFYTPDPGQLEEEYTRYLYALQIKRDLSEGLLLCSDATASLLVSYILQAEFGDHADNVNNQTNYFKEKNFFPHQTEDHEVKIIEYYKNHTGQTPADADLNLLDIARKVELYGIIMHPAKDHEGVQLNLAVAHMGILVFQNYTKINTFSWAKIRKLSFRRKKFLVKLHPENYGFYKDTVEFYFENRDESKNFWKKCIENHSFFRCISTQRMPRQKSKLLTRGSSFRYYGRTQKELIENTRENFSKNRSFDRSYHSMRCISQLGGVGGTGGSSGQINGTQSLNRNLASRSTGALMVPTSQQANLSSTLSSNDSNQNFHNYNQNTSSSAHHIAFMPTLNGDYHASNKTASLKHQASMEKSIIDQQQDPLSVQSLNNFQQNTQKQFRHDNDTSTHGSRTIDSRFSRDKTLNLSDEDNNNGHNDDDDDENENDGEDDNVDDNEDEAEEATAEKFLVPEPSKEENKKKKKPDEKCLCKHDIDTSHIPIQKQQALTNSGQKSRPSDNNDYSVNLFKGVNFKSSPIITGNSQPIYQTINQQQQQQQKLISLPIQQQKTYSKSKILNDDHRHHHHETEQPSATTTTSLVPVVSGSTNPNKIYSRKEVITTYKEETKNTHLEEYHQTTTFFDTPSGSVEYLSTVPQPLSHPHIITNTSLSKSANKNHMQHSPGHQHQVYQEMSKPGMESIYTNGLLSRSTPPTASGTAYSAPPKQLIKSTKVKTTTVTTTTPLKIARSKRQDDKDPNENNEDNDENDNQSDSNSKDDDTDNDNEAAAAISANVDEKTLNDLAVPDQADQELADDHTDDDKDQEDDNGDEKEIILSKISVNKKNKTNMENETENTNNKNNKSNNSSPVSIKSIEPKSPTPTNRSKLSNSDDSESVQDRINLTRMKSIDVEDENDDEEIKANEKNDEKEENDCENESKVTTSHKSNTKNKTDNKPKLKPKKKLSQTPVVVTSTSLSVWHEHRPVTEKKNKNKINFANLMSPDHSEDSENEENSSIYIEEHKKFQPKFSAPVSKKSAKKNAFNSGFKFSLSSSISASSLAFLSQLTESSSSSSSTHSLASSITSSLDDFSFMKSSSSSTSLSASLASVQSVLSSSKSRDSTPVPKLDLKKLPKTSKHSSSNNRKNAPSVSFQTIKKYNLETNILRVKHKQDENLHLLKSKSNKKETSKKKKQPTIHLVKAEIDDSSENEVHKSSSSRSSQNSTKKENIKEQEIIKSCPDIHRKFKSLPRSSSKRQADSACKKHAEIRNKMKIYPTTIMSVSQSDFGTVINQVDVKTNLMITSSTMPSPKKDKKIKKTSKKDNITSNITEDKTTRGSVSSLSSMQSKQSDLVCKNEILEEINEPTVEKLNSIESDIDHDDKQKAADVSFKSSDDGDYVLEDSENKAKQVLLKMEKENNFHKKKVIIKESNDNDYDDDNDNENDEDKDEKEDEKASDDKESILSSSNQEQQQQQKNELKDKKRIKLSVKKFSDNI